MICKIKTLEWGQMLSLSVERESGCMCDECVGEMGVYKMLRKRMKERGNLREGEKG